VEPPDGVDYQMVVDANVGGTKGDVILQKSVRDRVEVFADGVALHELVARYSYPSGVVDPTVPKKADPAYRDSLRFYIPEESSVTGMYATSAAGSRVGSSIEDVTVEHGKKVVGTFFRLPPGQSIELHLLYQTPVAPGGSYRLYVQKQAGVMARPVQLTVSYPGGVQGRVLAGNRDEEVTLRW
jgi:hypothetical protein